jgi:hypothetical protein
MLGTVSGADTTIVLRQNLAIAFTALSDMNGLHVLHQVRVISFAMKLKSNFGTECAFKLMYLHSKS